MIAGLSLTPNPIPEIPIREASQLDCELSVRIPYMQARPHFCRNAFVLTRAGRSGASEIGLESTMVSPKSKSNTCTKTRKEPNWLSFHIGFGFG